jgi:hypothetical protein
MILAFHCRAMVFVIMAFCVKLIGMMYPGATMWCSVFHGQCIY